MLVDLLALITTDKADHQHNTIDKVTHSCDQRWNTPIVIESLSFQTVNKQLPSAAIMAPPTPPELNSQELQDGFDQLLQHNARGQPQTDSFAFDHGPYMPGPAAPFTTPEPEQGQWYADQYGNKSFLYHDQRNPSGDLQFVSRALESTVEKMNRTNSEQDGYGQPAYNIHRGGPYHNLSVPQQQHVRFQSPWSCRIVGNIVTALSESCLLQCFSSSNEIGAEHTIQTDG